MLFTLLTRVSADCTQPQTRVEWRQLQPFEQENYLSAVKCLRQVPSVLDSSIGSPSRYDDFVWLHWEVLNMAHSQGTKNAHFLPWHRLYLHWYEVALRHYCGYQNRIPYWDWTYDAADGDHSPLWANEAFGGSGWSDTCVHDGAFAGSQAKFPTAGCLARNLQLTANGHGFDAATVNYVLNHDDYISFSEDLQLMPHGYIHIGIGGSMGSLTASTNDPIFFLHHANVDRLWAAWQKAHPDANIGGDHVSDVNGEQVTPAAFGDILNTFGIFQDLPGSRDYSIADAWWTVAGPFCYTYSTVPDGLDLKLRRRSIQSSLKDLHISANPCTLMTPQQAHQLNITAAQLENVHSKEKHLCDFRDFVKKQVANPMMASSGKLSVSQLYKSFVKKPKIN